MWEAGKSVSDYTKGSHPADEWDGETVFDLDELISINPSLAFVDDPDEEEEEDCGCGSGCGCEAVASRPGPKSSAQPPAKPSERKKGSSKNKPGSAGSGGGKITFSESIVKSLKEKVKEHNAKHSKKVTVGQLKKVYRRGAGAFSSSHRPGMSRGGWAMARVNMFLKMKRGGKVKDSYRKADGDI